VAIPPALTKRYFDPPDKAKKVAETGEAQAEREAVPDHGSPKALLRAGSPNSAMPPERQLLLLQ
jgi:hypothetical protein